MRCCWGKVLVTQASVGVGGAVLQIEQLASKGDCIKRGQTVLLAGDCVEGIFLYASCFLFK